MSLTTSQNGINLIKKFEGCRLAAYKDAVGVITIGYGWTKAVDGKPLTMNTRITQSKAESLLKEGLKSYETKVNKYYNKYHWNQNQFDALVSFCYNIGNIDGLTANGTRSIKEIANKITAYNKAGGKVLQGLVDRRAAEKRLFNKSVSSVSTSTSISTTVKNVKPISYLQTDSRWKNHNYSAKGEKKTIGSSGCGVTAAAMVIATLKDKNVTPITTAEWSMAHGYKALNQGTYYSYFVPQFSVYGISCKMLNQSNLYGKFSSTAHTEALNALKNGNWVIACMGKGNWTSSGHFIILYKYENGYVYINDPASVKSNRIKNTWTLFAKQVKYMWTVTVPDNFKNNNLSFDTEDTYTKTDFIKDVQSAIGAKVDGIAGNETYSKCPTVSKLKNNRHAVVKPLQKYLNACGFSAGTPDGIAGVKFDNAAKAWAKANGCVADGEFTKKGKSWRKILGIKL